MSWKLHVRLLCINKMQLNLVQKCTMRCDKRQYYRSAKHHVLLKEEDLMYIKLSHALHKWNTVVSYTPNAYHLLIGDRRRLLKEWILEILLQLAIQLERKYVTWHLNRKGKKTVEEWSKTNVIQIQRGSIAEEGDAVKSPIESGAFQWIQPTFRLWHQKGQRGPPRPNILIYKWVSIIIW